MGKKISHQKWEPAKTKNRPERESDPRLWDTRVRHRIWVNLFLINKIREGIENMNKEKETTKLPSKPSKETSRIYRN